MPPAALQAVGVGIFVAVWLLILRSQWPCLPLGRAVSATGGAAAFVLCGLLTSHDAFGSVNIETIGLLTGCMLVSAHLEKQGGYAVLARALTAAARGSAYAFLGLVCAAASVSAALLTNDTACVTLTPVILDACRARRLHPAPFLLALATSANIGAACSPIGSPQNMLIAVTSGMTFPQFLAALGLPATVGVCANFCILAALHRGHLRPGAPRFDWERGAPPEQLLLQAGAVLARVDDEHSTGLLLESRPAAVEPLVLAPVPPPLPSAAGPSTACASALTTSEANAVTASAAVDIAPSLTAGGGAGAPSAATGVTLALQPEAALCPGEAPTELPRVSAPHLADLSAPPRLGPCCVSRGAWRAWSVRCILALFPVLLGVGSVWIGMGWTALSVASVLCFLDGEAPRALLAKVDGELLLFFSALFVCVAGLNATGLPQQVWGAVAGAASVSSASGVTVFSLVVLVGSQVVSNVPLVLLLSPRILELPASQAALAWALLSWVSTVGGNLTLLGSVANLIVAERAKSSYTLGFVEYGRVGVPSTAVMCLFGVPLVCALVAQGAVRLATA